MIAEPTEDGQRWPAVYLAVQGIGTVSWWLAMWGSDTLRGWFAGDTEESWDAAVTIAAADIVVFGFGSVAAAIGIARGARWQYPALWLVVGAAWYATLVSAAWLAAPVERWAGLVVMLPAAFVTTAVAVSRSSQS